MKNEVVQGLVAAGSTVAVKEVVEKCKVTSNAIQKVAGTLNLKKETVNKCIGACIGYIASEELVKKCYKTNSKTAGLIGAVLGALYSDKVKDMTCNIIEKVTKNNEENN